MSVALSNLVNDGRLYTACLELFKRYPHCVSPTPDSNGVSTGEMFLDCPDQRTLRVMGVFTDGMTGIREFLVHYLLGGVNNWDVWHVATSDAAVTRRVNRRNQDQKEFSGYDPAILDRLSRGVPYGPNARLFGYRPSTSAAVSVIICMRSNPLGTYGVVGPDRRSHGRVEPILAQLFPHESQPEWPQPLWYLGAQGFHTLIIDGRLVPLDGEIAQQSETVWWQDNGSRTAIYVAQPSTSLLLTGQYLSLNARSIPGPAVPPQDLREDCWNCLDLDRRLRALLARS